MIEDLRTELRKLAIKQHVRPATHSTFVANGKSCAVCKGEWKDGDPEHHALTCCAVPFAFQQSPATDGLGKAEAVTEALNMAKTYASSISDDWPEEMFAPTASDLGEALLVLAALYAHPAKPRAYWLEHPKFGMELSLDQLSDHGRENGWIEIPLCGPAK